MNASILIIEPDRRLAADYAAALQGSAAGYTVDCRATAQDGILAADDATPDLVLLELQLVAHGGIEFLYEFRSYADWRDVPVLIVSHVPPAEFAGSRQMLEGRLGVRGYFYKPYMTLRQLVAAVDEALTLPVAGTTA